jgi:hypothetical protein
MPSTGPGIVRERFFSVKYIWQLVTHLLEVLKTRRDIALPTGNDLQYTDFNLAGSCPSAPIGPQTQNMHPLLPF